MADPYSPYGGQPQQPYGGQPQQQGGYYPAPGQGGQPAYQPGQPGQGYGTPGAPGYGPGGPGGPGFGPGGPYGPGMPPPRKSGSSTGVIIGVIAGVLVLIVGLVVAIVLIVPDEESTGGPGGGGVPSAEAGGGGAPQQQGNAPQSAGEIKPTKFYDSQPISVYSKIANRSADAEPTTLEEVFGEAKRLPTYGPFQGIQVSLKDSRIDTDCASAAWGSGLQQKLRSADCNQLVRGVYVDDSNRYLGQIFILNLRDEQGAVSAMQGMDPKRGGDGFLKPLTGAPAENFGRGYSEARTDISGHWLVITWVQYADGASEKSFGDLIPMGVVIGNADNFIVKRNVNLR